VVPPPFFDAAAHTQPRQPGRGSGLSLRKEVKSLPTPQKEARVRALKESVAASSGMYLAEFQGLSVAALTDLRTRVLEAGGRIEIAKNRLLKLALAGTPAQELEAYLEGPTAVTFCTGDPFAPARAMKEFARTLTADTQRWNIKAAYVDGQVFGPSTAPALADLPSTEEIKSSVVGAIAGPTSALVHTLNGLLSDVVYTLQAVADKRSAA